MISKTNRFEIFKRDGFSCRYCGKTSPEVVLEVDHIVPRSAGGGDDPVNLVTACFACNRGKGRRRLGSVKTGESAYTRAVELLEQEREIKELEEVQAKIELRINNDINTLRQRWEFEDSGWNTIRCMLRSNCRASVSAGLDVVWARFGQVKMDYLYGILKNWKNGTKTTSRQGE